MMSGDVAPMMLMIGRMIGCAGCDMGMMAFDSGAGRVALLKADLGITEAQVPRWDGLLNALRGSAVTMRIAMRGSLRAGMQATGVVKVNTMVVLMTTGLEAAKPTTTG